MITWLLRSRRKGEQNDRNTAQPGALRCPELNAFFKLPLTRREFITDSKGELWCIEIRKCTQTNTVLKGKWKV